MHEQSLPIEEEIYGPLKLFLKKKNSQCTVFSVIGRKKSSLVNFSIYKNVF